MSVETRPFLPEPDPPQPAPKSRAKRTLLLWVLLIVMFLAIWQFLSPGPSSSAHATAPPPPPCDNSGSFWTSTLTTMLPLGVLFLVVVWFLAKLREVATFNLSQEPGRLALAERRFADAAEVFRAAATAQSRQPLYQALAVFSLARTQLWSGQLEQAIESLARVEKVNVRDLRGPPLRSSGIRMKAAFTLVLANALLGDLETAERWAEDTRVRIAKNQEDRLLCAASLCLGEAVIALRRGRPGDALASLEKNWLALRDTLTANDVRIAEILRAFAEASGGVREYNTVGERLIRVEPVSGNEFAFLGVRWPAMHAFLVSHRLVPPDGSPTPG